MGKYRAWRFSYPGFDQPDDGDPTGVELSKTGVNMIDERASIRQSILLLLSTRPGERLMRPTYGCYIHMLLFSPNDDTTAGLAMYYVRKALEIWEPRVELLFIDAQRDPQYGERLNIELEYQIRANRQTDNLTYSIDLTGG